MKIRNSNWIYLFIIIIITFSLANSCTKDTTNNDTTPVSFTAPIAFNDSLTYGTVSDFDGNNYKTIVIGTQTWMAQNLSVTHYSNGAAIANVRDNTAWSNLTTGAYCNYNNDVSLNSKFGKLYNFYTVVDPRNVCPTGWHVPTDSNWIILVNYLKGGDAAGAYIKEAGELHWADPNTGATNDSGFTALPSGYRLYDGTFRYAGYNAEYWTSDIDSMYGAVDRYLEYNSTRVGRVGVLRTHGFSVRCIKNN